MVKNGQGGQPYVTGKIVMAGLLILSFLFMGCISASEDSGYCRNDSDCICDGYDTKTDSCYIGNLDYYNKYVNKTRDCPDFCTGIAGNLEVKCVNNRCSQVRK